MDHPLLFRYTWLKCVEVSFSSTDILEGLSRLILIYSPHRKSLIPVLLLPKNGFGWHLLLENWLFLSFLYPRILFICRSVLKKLKRSADFQIKIHFDLYYIGLRFNCTSSEILKKTNVRMRIKYFIWLYFAVKQAEYEETILGFLKLSQIKIHMVALFVIRLVFWKHKCSNIITLIFSNAL